MARQATTAALFVWSPVFSHEGWIPAKYTCDGANINPPLEIKNLPQGTKSLALIMEDPDAPISTWDHWVVWNISPRNLIRENCIPGTEGFNSFQAHHYHGPCPPSGIHRYFFKVFALDTVLDIDTCSNKHKLKKAMTGHVLARGETVGLYEKENWSLQ